MAFRFFFKVVRRIATLLIIVLVLLCLLYALLQSKWAKAQIKGKIVSLLEEAGIRAQISNLEGEPPFSWKIEEIHLELGRERTLYLSNLRFRIAILPLLKGQVSINYFKVDEAKYACPFDTDPNAPWTFAEGKTLLRKQLENAALPFPIALRRFSVDRLTLINTENDSSLTFGIAGRARARKDLSEFALDFSLFSAEGRETYLEATLIGSERRDFIITNFKLKLDAIPTFLGLHLDGAVDTTFSLKGPWTTWRELLYDLPRTQDPLEGLAKGMITNTHIAAAPLFDRDWKFKTLFSLHSGHSAYIHNFLVSSNLLHIKGKADLEANWEDSTAIFAFSTPDLSLLSPFATFPISGDAKGKGTLQDGNFKLSFETHALQLKTFAAHTVRGLIKGSKEGNFWEAQTQFSSTDAVIPFDTSFAIEFIPNELLSFIDFKAQAPDISLSGFLSCNLVDTLWDGSIRADVQHLDRFDEILYEENLNGGILVELTLSSEDDKQDVQCALVGKNMRYKKILVDDLTLSSEVKDLFNAPEGRFSLLAEKVYTPSFYLDRLNFGTQSDEVHWPFYLDAQGRIESPFECYAKGFWQKGASLFALELTNLFGELSKTPFLLKHPFEVEWGADYLNLSPFDFKIGEGNLYATFELSPVRTVGTWELNHFPLEVLNCVRPRFALDGFISAAGFLDAGRSYSEGALNAVLEEAGVLHFGKKEPFRAKGSLQAHLSNKLLQVHSTLNATDAQFLDFNATLPITYDLYPLAFSFDRTKNTTAELIAEGKLEDLLDFVNMGTNNFTGLLSCRLFLSQTLDHPSLLGTLELQDGTYENYFTGIDLRNIDALFEARNDEILLVHMTANDDKSGEVSATGKIDLIPEMHFPYSFEAEMKQLHALGFDMIDCDLTGPVYFTGDTHNMTAQGNLLVDEAKIQVTERLPYDIPSLPVTFVHMPKHLISRTASKGPNFEFHIDLELTADNNVRVEGIGLNAELEGNVRLYGTNTRIFANGGLQLIKGEYVFSGKVFKLSEGEVLFNDKPTPSAHLNIVGELSMPDITITAMMRGPLTSPQLTFQSNPYKPTSSIMALILFNKEITEISHPEAIQLANTLVSLSGGAAPDVLESIRKSIGIDRLNIASKPGTDEVALQIGKYLTRGIMITLSQSATSSQVIVDVELPKGFVFTAETQEEEEGKFSLKWRKTY